LFHTLQLRTFSQRQPHGCSRCAKESLARGRALTNRLLYNYQPGKRGYACLAVLLTGLCLGAFSTIALGIPPEETIRFSSYTSSQGLSNNSVACLLQDRKGLLWIGTQGGLNCYDGYQNRVFHHHPSDPHSPSSESIYTLVEDRRGRMWIGTSAGLELWQNFNRVREFTSDGTLTISEDPDGGLWFACWSRGLLHLAPGADSLTLAAPPDSSGIPSFRQVLGMLADRQGRIWMGIFKRGLYRYTPASGKIEKITLPSPLPEGATDHVYHAILQDDQERIWVASLQGLYCLDGGVWRHYRHDPTNPRTLANDNILALCMTDSQHLWIGTDGSGLDRLDPSSGRFYHYPPGDKKSGAFPAAKVTALLRDRTGLLWAGSQGEGLIKIISGRTELIHSSTLLTGSGDWLSEPAWRFHEDSIGTIWIGGQSGLQRLDPSRGLARTLPLPAAIRGGLPIRGIWVQDSSTIWLGTQSSGLWQWHPGSGKTKHFLYQNPRVKAINSQVIYDMQPDRAGGLWLACNSSGLIRFDLATAAMERILPPGLTNDQTCWVTDLLLTGEQLWFTTWSEGLFIMNVRSRTPRKIGWLRPDALDQVYPLLSLCGDASPLLWVGSYGGGFYRLNTHDSTSTLCLAPAGLSDNVVFAIEEDQQGRIWYSSNNGLICYDEQRDHFKSIDLPAALDNHEFNQGASLHSRAGELFFGGMQGFCRISPRKLNNSVPPVLLVAEVQTGRETLPYYLPPDEMPRLRFTEGDHPFRIRLLALHHLEPEKNQYAYRLQGLNESWIDLQQQREILLPHLPPGRFTLQLRAANGDGLWSHPAAVHITVATTFLQSLWFKGFLLAMIFTAAMAFYRARLYQIRAIESARMQEREEIRTRIAQDFHDELGHRLSKILLFSRTAAAENEHLSPTGQAALEKIIDNSTALNKEMRQFLWELDPGKDSLQDLLVELKHFSEDLFDRTDIAFELRGLVPELEQIILPLDWRSNILRIFKEAMVNVFKHAGGCSEVVLAVELRQNQFILQLINNGCSFDLQTVAAGEGLKNMRRRAEKIGAKLEISSADHQTIVVLIHSLR